MNYLDKEEGMIFDDMFDISILYNCAGAYSAKYVRIDPIFMSIVFHHYKQPLRMFEEPDQTEQNHGSG
jgi:hypothetical protein